MTCRPCRSPVSATRNRSIGCAARASSKRSRDGVQKRSRTRDACWIAPDIDAVIAAVPCDLHESISCDTLRAGKHLYAEKPSAITLAGCDRLSLEASRRPALAIHVGFQRRSNPRFRAGVERIQGGELGPLIEARATWTSSNGPLGGHGGWLGRRDRSGDFMVEQAVHIWDVLHWMHGDLPVNAAGGAGVASLPSKTPAAT